MKYNLELLTKAKLNKLKKLALKEIKEWTLFLKAVNKELK